MGVDGYVLALYPSYPGTTRGFILDWEGKEGGNGREEMKRRERMWRRGGREREGKGEREGEKVRSGWRWGRVGGRWIWVVGNKAKWGREENNRWRGKGGAWMDRKREEGGDKARGWGNLQDDERDRKRWYTIDRRVASSLSPLLDALCSSSEVWTWRTGKILGTDRARRLIWSKWRWGIDQTAGTCIWGGERERDREGSERGEENG
jgi:hypothetical protein